MNEQELAEKGAGMGNFVKGMAGSAMSKSSNAKQRAQGKRMKSNAAAKRAATPAGKKRKVKKLVDAMLTQWSKYENKQIVNGGKRSADMFNTWYKGFMGPDREANISTFQDSPTDQKFYNFLMQEVPQFAAAPAEKPAAVTRAAGDDQAAVQAKANKGVTDALSQHAAASAGSGRPNSIAPGTKKVYAADNEAYTWKGAQWISDKTGRAAEKLVAQALNNQAVSATGAMSTENKMYKRLMSKYLIESGQRDLSFEHGRLSRYLEHHGAQIEDWQDQARLMMRWWSEFGPDGWRITTMKPPAVTGLGSYMYVGKIEDEAGNEKWIAYDDEAGVADITDHQPNPAGYS